MDADLTARILRLVSELKEIQEQLSYPGTNPKTGLAVPKLPLDVAQRLKAAVDTLRLFLWAYLDTFSGEINPQEKLQQIRIESAADMLHLLHQDFRVRGVPRTPQSQRLCQQILAMKDVANVAVR